MNGSLTYGPKGRLAAVIAMILACVGALQASNILTLLPPKYYWVGLVVTFIGVLFTGISERVQGGASSPQVRHDAAQSDIKNAKEEANEEIDLNDINC